MKRVLLTGAGGFAGTYLAERLVQRGYDVTSLDALTYAGSLAGIAHLPVKNVCLDLGHPLPQRWVLDNDFDYVVHNAAESHVVRSVIDPGLFIRSNVLGTMHLLEAAMFWATEKFIYVSTDEVFGPAGDEPYCESDRLNPTNPYAATKASGEFLVRSYGRSFQLPWIITRTTNMFGKRQHPEKFVPMIVGKLLIGEEVDVHVSRTGEVGSRQWVYAGEQARRVVELMEFGQPGTVHHVAGERKTNLGMAQDVARILGRKLRPRFVVSDRPYHDLHYAIKGTHPDREWKLTEDLLDLTVRWYARNPRWLDA